MIRAELIPKRIVLSRKGFDSSFGGCASPIIDGQMISLPIPERNRNKSQLCYGELRNRQTAEIADLANQLSKGKIEDFNLLHLDPDLRIELRDKKHAHFPFAFGQSGSSQTELKTIAVGDLFLFFGWFRDATKLDGKYVFCRNSPDVYAIWGWLQVEERLELPEQLARAQAIAPHHPHVVAYRVEKNNCLYVGMNALSFLVDSPGAGVFTTLTDVRRLSDKQLDLPPRKRLRTNWSLPAFFKNKDMHVTHIPNLSEWKLSDDCESVLGRAAYCPGQEFVFETKGHEAEIAKWLDGIFSGR
jgi:hypothetical protein